MTSLSSLKNAGELFAELKMSRTGFAGSFLLVEGDDDHRFWRRRVAANDCELVIGGGRLNVEGCIARVDEHDFRGALGIVDADFSGIDGASPSPNLIYTEHHDLEAMLLQSSALEAVLDEYGDAARIAAFEARAGHDVRTALLARGLVFGQLRWVSLRLRLGINFDKLPAARFVKPAGWRLDDADLHATAASLCGRPLDDLRSQIAALPDAPSWMLCQGHDLLHILNIGLAQTLGHSYPGHDRIAMMLRQAFKPHELQATALHRDIRAWESRNPPYRVLPPPPPTPTSPP